MRMRKKKHGAERLLACAHLLCERPGSPLAEPAQLFGRDGAVYLEIGCGKGGFSCAMAARYPERSFLAMEKVSDVLVLAAERAVREAESRPDNLRFINGDARDLSLWFSEGSLDGIYLNFSDPWPKAGHKKRRLTHRDFLSMYFSLLREGGSLVFKTDNDGLFAFTLEELEALGYTPCFVTDDLHASSRAADNIMTEYERAFSEQGMKIHSLEVQKGKK